MENVFLVAARIVLPITTKAVTFNFCERESNITRAFSPPWPYISKVAPYLMRLVSPFRSLLGDVEQSFTPAALLVVFITPHYFMK